MRNLKKFLALVLAMMMTLSLMVTANAKDITADFTDADSVTEEFTTAVDVLNGMKVFRGYENGTFDPKGEITRAEMAAIIYRLHTGDAEDTRANAYVGYDSFTDVAKDKWYAGYVGYCSNAGLIAGYGNGRFGPSDKLTGYQALVMLLRAMGYDQPNEFGKSDWRTHAASIATQRGMLDNVNKTNYKGTLSDNATRELVAELTFQAADLARVKYTPAYGYQTGDHTNQDNYVAYQSLGYLNYGLTEVEGIIVGNQDTGESSTRINYAAKGYDEHFGYFHQTKNWDEDVTVKDGEAANTTTTVSVTIDAKTGIDMFGHKVDAYYDARPGYGGTTYALYDNVVHTAVVALAKDDITAVLSLDTWAAKGQAPLGEAAQQAGFKVDLKRSKAVFNQSFGISASDANATTTVDGKSDYTTGGAAAYKANVRAPINTAAVSNSNKNHGCTQVATTPTTYPLYLLISNNSAKTVDMVVALNVEVSRIAEVNNHATYPTVTVPTATGITTWNNNKVATDNARISQGALTATSDKTLTDPVVGVVIAGTNSAKNTVGWDDANNGRPAGYTQPVGSALTEDKFYRLSKPTQYVEGVVTQYNYTGCGAAHADDDKHTGKIVIDGKTIERSLLADTITATSGLSASAQLYGRYRAYLDSEGKYIYLEPVFDNKFVYGTYVDYATPLGSSAYEYTIVGVDLDGKQVVEKFTSFDGNVMSSDSAITGTKQIDEVGIPYRDSANISGVSRASYLGFTLTGNGGLLSKVTPAGAGPNTPDEVPQLPTTVYTGKGTGAPIQAATHTAAAPLTISSIDAKLGMKVTGNANLYFTDDTKFIIVDGAGTDTQKVEVLTGLTELLKGGSKVTIRGDAVTATDDLYLDPADTFADMIYYTKSPFVYASVAGNPEKVDAIFIPKDAMSWSGASNLFYVGNPAQDSEITVGTNTFHLYTMYENGEPVQKWLVNDPDVTGDVTKNGKLVKDSFYELDETPFTTPGGETVYMAHDAETNAPGTKDTSQGIADALVTPAANDATTSRPKVTAKPIVNNVEYSATTYASQTASIGNDADGTMGTDYAVFNVANAKVVNLNAASAPSGLIWPGITDLTSLNDAASTSQIYNTTFPKVSVQTDPSDPYTVTVIYVNWDQN